jgi:hypothetical protein
MKGFQVSEVLRGYIVAALWSTNNESTPEGGVPLDQNYDENSLDPATRDKLRAKVVKFLELAEESALLTYFWHKKTDPSQGTISDYLGHDIWLTSNGHGAGFWDRSELPRPVTEHLTQVAHEIGGVDLYVGDDGNIYG